MICLHPRCSNTSRTRGLCHSCYQAARDRIRHGKATEEDLVRRRLLTPKGMGGTKGGDANVFNLGRTEEGRQLTWLVDFYRKSDPYTGYARTVPAWSADEARQLVHNTEEERVEIVQVRTIVE